MRHQRADDEECKCSVTPTLILGERALMMAQGKVLTLLVTALYARSRVEAKEFSDLPALFSIAGAEESELESDILACWAGIMRESL